MPEPHAGAESPDSRRKDIEGSALTPTIVRSSSDRLHVALGVALVAVAFVALAFPVTGQTGDGDSAGIPTLVVSDGLTATIQSQAQTVVSAVAGAGPVATPQAETPSQSMKEFPGAALVPRSLLKAAATVLMRGALAGQGGQQPLAIELQRPVRFTLVEGGLPIEVFSARPTVGGALTALGSGYNRYDLIWPQPDTPLTSGLRIFVQRATQVRLAVGGEEAANVYTHTRTVGELLAERGVELSESDKVEPGLSARLRSGLAVSVTFIGKQTEVEDTPLPFATIYRDDNSFTEGELVLEQEGVDGFVRREYEVVYVNGEETSRELVSEITVPPTYRVVLRGTAPEPTPVAVAAAVSPPSGDPSCANPMTVWATWYTAESAGGSGTTATGTTVHKGTVAVDPRVIPLGTQMYIPGYGYGVAEDTGGAIIGNIIDLGYGADDVKDWSSRWVDICILN